MRIIIAIFGLLLISSVQAYEISSESVVTQITAQTTDHRFVINGGTLCGTNVFTIHTTTDSGREQFALILAAATSGKKILLEIWAACPSTDPTKNWGMSTNYIAITAKY